MRDGCYLALWSWHDVGCMGVQCVFSNGIVTSDETKPDWLSAGTLTMLARINKHIPRASELRMVILFLITNTISCPAWDIMQITGDVGFCSADLLQMNTGPGMSWYHPPSPTPHWTSEYSNPIYQTGEPVNCEMSSIWIPLNWIHTNLANFVKSVREG